MALYSDQLRSFCMTLHTSIGYRATIAKHNIHKRIVFFHLTNLLSPEGYVFKLSGLNLVPTYEVIDTDKFYVLLFFDVATMTCPY